MSPFPPYAVPAPRDHGPDGRAEGGLLLTGLDELPAPAPCTPTATSIRLGLTIPDVDFLGPGMADDPDEREGFALDVSTLR